MEKEQRGRVRSLGVGSSTGFKCWLHHLLTLDPLGKVHSCTCFLNSQIEGGGLTFHAEGSVKWVQHKMSLFSHQRGREMTSDPNTHLPGAQALFLLASGYLPLSTRCFQVLCVLVLASWGGS